ncbi:hypothetical protein ES703_75948 [subsurface metagenome]
MKDLVVIEQLPEVPADWDYEESVARVKQVIYKWKNLTVELATELYIAREALSKPGRPYGRYTWKQYCQAIGVHYSTVNRWLNQYFLIDANASIKSLPFLPPGLYNVICADPPWRYDFSETESRSIEAHYKTLSVEEICSYKDGNGTAIQDKFAEDAVLFLWATQPKIREALQVIEAWGFDYKTGAVWVKDKFGMGYYFREQHELLFVAKKGNMPVPNPEDRPTSIINAPRLQHSRKPDEVYQSIEKMYPKGKYLEMFATRTRPGWKGFGLEVKEEE